MADESRLPPHRSKNNPQVQSETNLVLGEAEQSLELDIGDDNLQNSETNRLGNQDIVSGSNDNHGRREENPFSFKHFLRNNNSYQNKGARPKVYCDGRPVANIADVDIQPGGRIAPEYQSALPDFVQDHLVIEQCYLGNNYQQETVDNLPDFTQRGRSSVDSNLPPSNVGLQNGGLPPFDAPRPRAEFPLDLPLVNNSSPPGGDGRGNEVGVSKSLPDFLADGAVRPSQTIENFSSSAQSPEREVDRLRRELEATRRQLSEQTRRADNLGRDLELARNSDRNYAQNLARALEQVEDNLEKSNRRASSAESTVLKLRQEIKALNIQVNSLKLENRSMRQDEGAAGGPNLFNAPNEIHSQRLAQELRSAASTAEHSLRQLLTGVDNLRIMAASLENMHRIEEKDDFLNLEDDSSGPAL